MRRKIWKKMLAAGCAASLLVTAPGMTVLADQLQEDEVIETEAEDPGDDVINENGAEQSEDVLEESAEDVITIEEGTEPLSIEEKTVDSVDEAETVGSEEYTVGDGVTATFDEDTGTVEFYSEGGTLSEYWRYKLWDKMEEIKSIKVASGTVFLPEDSDSIFSICYEEYSEGYEGYERYVSNLEEFDSSGFDTSNVTSMYKMFEYCNKLTALDLSNFDTSKVRNMGYMFSGCTDLKNIDLGSFDTSYVTGMYNMFTDCESLTNLDLSSFNTSNVTDMSNMFYECYSLSELNLGSFNTSNVTDMRSMFYYCNSLTNLDLSNFNTSNVTDMSNMFSGCSSLTNLNLSSFDTSNTEYYYNIFYKCKGLISLRTPQKNSLTINLPVAMYDESGAMYSKLPVLSSSITLTGKGNGEILVGDNVIATYDEETGAVEFYSNDGELWNSWLDDSEIDKKAITSIKVASGTVYLPSDSSGIFSVSDYDDDEGRYVSGLIDLDLSGFDTSNVTDMRGMFVGCSSLKNLDLQNFNTSKVTSMWGLFADCASLNELDLSVFDTTNVTSFYHMFSGCTNLISLDISSFVLDSDSMEIDDEDYYTDCLYMFDGCNNLSSVKTPLSNNVCDIALPVVMCDEEGTLYYSLPVMTGSIELKLPSQSGQEYRYNVGEGATATFDAETGEIVVYSDGGTLWRNWLGQFDKSRIQSIKLAETSSSVYLPADSSNMFRNCYNLSNLDLKGFDTSNVTDMTRLFGYCYSLEELDVSGFNTAKVQQMDYMFEECHSLKELDLSSFDTVNVNDMGFMFYYCYSLTDLNLSSFNTRNVRYMRYMFSDCSNLTNLDLSSFVLNDEAPDLSDDPEESDWDDYENRFEYMFNGCEDLISLKTPMENNAYVELPFTMYDESGNPNYSLPKQTGSILLKKFPSRLIVGDAVTATYDSETKTIEFHSDEGTLWSDWIEKTGMNRDDIEVIRVASGIVHLPSDCSGIYTEEDEWGDYSLYSIRMFCDCNKLKTLDLRGFDTSNVTNMGSMFSGCSALESLDLSSFDTSNVTDMSHMFSGCTNLSSLDLSGFNTSNVTNMSYMFFACYSLTNLNLSGFDTSNLEEPNYYYDIFEYCNMLSVLKTPKENSLSIELPVTMYDETGNEYTRLPVLSKSITLTKDKPGSAIGNISDCTVSFGTQSYTYDGKEKKPTVTVKLGSVTLSQGTDYSVTYLNNTNSGTAKVKITGTGNYKGEQTATFTIAKATPKLTFASNSVNKTTLDAAFTNELTKTTDGTVTFKSSDAKVATVDSTNGRVTINGEGTATITATAAEGTNYNSGSAKYTLTVVDGRTDVSELTVSLSATSYTYDGKAKEPTVTVKNGNTTLTSGTDYTVSYADNTNAGTATVKVEGTGKYKGEQTKTFTIAKADPKLTFASGSVNKTTLDAAFTNELTKTTDGTVTFTSSDTKVATVDSTNGRVTINGEGTATITATAAEGTNYNSGSAKYTLAVVDGRTDISGLTVSLSATSYTYDGKAKEPAVTVKNGSTTLTSKTDYTVSYSDNTNAGIATAKVTGAGKYKGEKSVTFTINKAEAKLSFAENSLTKKTTDAAFKNTLTKTTDGTVTFKSGNTKVATVDSASGLVTIKGAGTATITASSTEGKNYKAGSASFILTAEAPATPTPKPTVSGFSDVQNPNHAYYKAIYWAADAGITKGYPDGTFGIDKPCTRGEMMMFLWRYADKPAAKTVSKSPFKDVPKTHTFYKAILWGSQKGITKGYPDGTFGINRNVSRGECMMFLWRLRGKPAPKAVAKSPFSDVPKNHVFYNAILWGSQKKITTGYTSGAKKGTFGINENCTRGQIVTFLYRAK